MVARVRRLVAFVNSASDRVVTVHGCRRLTPCGRVAQLGPVTEEPVVTDARIGCVDAATVRRVARVDGAVDCVVAID